MTRARPADAVSPFGVHQAGITTPRPASGIEPMTRTAEMGRDGAWRVDDLVLPLSGTWHIDIEIRLSRFSLVRISGEVEIR